MDLAQETLGTRIRQAREASGKNQMDFAVAIGKRPEQVSRWERDEQTPGADVLAVMSKVLGVTIDWLVMGEPEAAA